MKRAADIVREHFDSDPPDLALVVRMVEAAQRDAITEAPAVAELIRRTEQANPDFMCVQIIFDEGRLRGHWTGDVDLVPASNAGATMPKDFAEREQIARDANPGPWWEGKSDRVLGWQQKQRDLGYKLADAILGASHAKSYGMPQDFADGFALGYREGRHPFGDQFGAEKAWEVRDFMRANGHIPQPKDHNQ